MMKPSAKQRINDAIEGFGISEEEGVTLDAADTPPPIAKKCQQICSFKFLGSMHVPAKNWWDTSLHLHSGSWCPCRTGRSVNPISTRGGQIMPTYLLMAPPDFPTF